MVDYKYFKKFYEIIEKYVPDYGDGETKASQTATAVLKIYGKWYNNGDVYDNSFYIESSYNDLSSYANWLDKYSESEKVSSILRRIYNCETGDDYEEILKDLADTLLDEEYLAEQDKIEKCGSVYECDGIFKFDCGNDYF